jgi:hypothetical protein
VFMCTTCSNSETGKGLRSSRRTARSRPILRHMCVPQCHRLCSHVTFPARKGHTRTSRSEALWSIFSLMILHPPEKRLIRKRNLPGSSLIYLRQGSSRLFVSIFWALEKDRINMDVIRVEASPRRQLQGFPCAFLVDR